jgi:hypothetical protein
MMTKSRPAQKYERRITIAICLSFLGLVFATSLLLLRWAGYEWHLAPESPFTGPGRSAMPYFSAPLPVRAPWIPARQSVDYSDVELSPLPGHRSALDLRQTSNVSVRLYVANMQHTEAKKRALLHAAMERSPDLHALVEQRTPDNPVENDLDTQFLAGNSVDGKKEVGITSLPVDDWDRLVNTFAQIGPPPGCSDLHYAYASQLKALRDIVLSRSNGSHRSAESATSPTNNELEENEQLQTVTRRADDALACLCAQFGLPKEFDIVIDDKWSGGS